MQQIETTVVPLYYDSNDKVWNLFNPSQISISDFSGELAYELSLLKQIEFYWMWDSKTPYSWNFNQADSNQLLFPNFYKDQFQPTQSNFKTSKHSLILMLTNIHLETQLFNERISWLLNLLDHVYDYESVVVKQARKIQRKCKSTRRSAYIGVSKNGPNWQAMISAEKMKSYIGTYVSEIEAAEMFDLYSLLVHGFSAKTNFSYSKAGIIDLISRHQEFSK